MTSVIVGSGWRLALWGVSGNVWGVSGNVWGVRGYVWDKSIEQA